MPDRATKPRSNRTGVATRAKIIDAAIAVLAEKGFAGFTLQAVADRADVLFGSVTHHYGTRDRLIEAMLAAILEAYRARFAELTAAIAAEDASPVRVLVGWLLDDAVDPGTAGIFLELWAMATHMPAVAEGVNGLYDDAVDACIAALGLSPRSRRVRRLREALYVLGTVVEGTSSIFGNRDRSDPLWRNVRATAIDLLVPFIEARLADAGAPRRTGMGARRVRQAGTTRPS
jgi:AcrR family transcriptional regulator